MKLKWIYYRGCGGTRSGRTFQVIVIRSVLFKGYGSLSYFGSVELADSGNVLRA
jgi:hypothetical protein